ncbi:alpha/beta hydrolase family protein [Hydrogenophaga palleronii]|uniref:alpha/beta hydrolase family protein n=1 Tax=Hydrogenophaga palleronii TaxID=65655 RepID=UPI0008257F91|nr:alpha/beta hydrolase [Hydrogenophaga palleronii]
MTGSEKRTPARRARWWAAGLLALSGVCAHAAGFDRLLVPANGTEPGIEALVWSPCATAAEPTALGPYVVQGMRRCPVAGEALPLVVISHGQGGDSLGHHDTATALADAGFVVVSLNHPGDSFGDDGAAGHWRIFESRPRDVSRVISFMQEDWPQRRQLKSQAIGVFGFSRGGYTALALVGAVPSAAAASARFCPRGAAPDAWPICRELGASPPALRPLADPRVRAAVVVDPLNLFDAAGLKPVRAPVQLWASALGGDGVEPAHVEAIRKALPKQSIDHQVADGAGHFVFLAPCTAALRNLVPQICEDPQGVNRDALHRRMNAAAVAFFRQHLR